jgi:serine/threonine protein kinase
MDAQRAARMTADLVGKVVGGWSVDGPLLGHGKSALVLKASRPDVGDCAIKVFDPEIVERSGAATQLERIRREVLTRDYPHSNLVRILDGGQCAATGYFYVVMENVALPILAQCLDSIPRDAIHGIIAKIAEVAQHLETHGFVHRDLKPANVAIDLSNFSPLVLDLGVLRQMRADPITDESGHPFVGTLQYSSPEYLYRREQDTVEGWRAVTFYQLGAILHDLIMRIPIFADALEPYAVLVDAVTRTVPRLHAPDVSPRLLQLADSCLVKDPALRRRLVKWADFGTSSDPSPSGFRREDFVARQTVWVANLAASRPSDSPADDARRLRRLEDDLREIVRAECAGSGLFPPLEFSAASATDGILAFQVCFRPRPSRGLPLHLTLRFSIRLLDRAADAVQVAAAVGLCSSSSVLLPDEALSPIFRGTAAPAPVSDAVLLTLYQALEDAQRVPHAGSSAPEMQLLKTRQDFAGGSDG